LCFEIRKHHWNFGRQKLHISNDATALPLMSSDMYAIHVALITRVYNINTPSISTCLR